MITARPKYIISEKALKEFQRLLRLAEFYKMKSVEEFKKAEGFAVENGIYSGDRYGIPRRNDKPKFMVVDPILTTYKQKDKMWPFNRFNKWQPIDYEKMYENNFY